MIYFSRLGEFGRLGNQMFQYAALLGLCLKKGYNPVLPDLNGKRWHGQRCLLNEFNVSAGLYDGEKIEYSYKEPTWRAHDPKFFDIKDNTSISGFFQSIYYFEEYQDAVKKELTPDSFYMDRNRKFINNIREMYGCEVVSVHLRRGDNMTERRSKPVYGAIYNDGGVYFRYFLKAKNVFKDQNVKFLIFTGGSRGEEDNTPDMDWCKKIFKGDEYIFSEGKRQIDDLARIMLCDHNIVSHISSFGWWGAYLNRNKNKIVVAPKSYHPEEPKLMRYKFYPKEYVLI